MVCMVQSARTRSHLACVTMGDVMADLLMLPARSRLHVSDAAKRLDAVMLGPSFENRISKLALWR